MKDEALSSNGVPFKCKYRDSHSIDSKDTNREGPGRVQRPCARSLQHIVHIGMSGCGSNDAGDEGQDSISAAS
jgi:hypothetical protein